MTKGMVTRDIWNVKELMHSHRRSSAKAFHVLNREVLGRKWW